jgi:hypothetical protein
MFSFLMNAAKGEVLLCRSAPDRFTPHLTAWRSWLLARWARCFRCCKYTSIQDGRCRLLPTRTPPFTRIRSTRTPLPQSRWATRTQAWSSKLLRARLQQHLLVAHTLCRRWLPFLAVGQDRWTSLAQRRFDPSSEDRRRTKCESVMRVMLLFHRKRILSVCSDER